MLIFALTVCNYECEQIYLFQIKYNQCMKNLLNLECSFCTYVGYMLLSFEFWLFQCNRIVFDGKALNIIDIIYLDHK